MKPLSQDSQVRMTLLTIGIEGKSHDTGSVSTIDAKVKAWMVKAAQADYQAIQKMLREDKELARQKVRIWPSFRGLFGR